MNLVPYSCTWSFNVGMHFLYELFVNFVGPKYVKLAKIGMIHVLGFVKDECCFSSISFLKNKMHNCLNQLL